MRRFVNHTHRVVIMDIEQPMVAFQSVLVDYSDDWSSTNEESLLLLTLNMLYVARATEEAIEAMEIHVNSFCHFTPTPFSVNRLRAAVRVYIREMSQRFHEAQLYDDQDRLVYAFSNWVGGHACHALLIPTTHSHLYPAAKTQLVGGEPYYNNPQNWFPKLSDELYLRSLMGPSLSPEFVNGLLPF